MANRTLRNLTFVETVPGVEWRCAEENAKLEQLGPSQWRATLEFSLGGRATASISDVGTTDAQAYAEAWRAALPLHMAIADGRVRNKRNGHFQDGGQFDVTPRER